jgi:putative DNA primase/helicase
LNPSNCEPGQLDELDETIVLQVATPHNPFRVGGTLDGWRDSVGAWAQGNSRVMLALCASLAGPLLEPSGMESGGFNFVGGSSTGKTTALVASGSIWGNGTSSGGYVQNWRATSNGLEGLAALHSDTALCLDEIGQAPGRTIMEAAYMLANGMGKARARQDGSARAAKHWRCIVLSTGEKGLADKIIEEGGKVQAGQSVRLIDVPADAGAGFGLFETLHGHTDARAFADALKQAAAAHYGHAARAFVRRLVEERQALLSDLRQGLENGIADICPADADGQVKRVARRFLLCAVAGEMATEWGILPWDEGKAMSAVKTCFDAWLTHRGSTGPAEDTAMLEHIRLFIEQHGASRFQDVRKPDATCINRVGFRKSEEGGGTIYYVLPDSFKMELCKGFDFKRAARLLLGKGRLLPGDSGGFTRRPTEPLPDYGRKRCYTLLFGGDDDGLA